MGLDPLLRSRRFDMLANGYIVVHGYNVVPYDDFEIERMF